jgi:hypothetical protein
MTIDRRIGGSGTAGIAASATAAKCCRGADACSCGQQRILPRGSDRNHSHCFKCRDNKSFDAAAHRTLASLGNPAEHERGSKVTMVRVLIIADDLSGAAECGIACVYAG